MYLCRILLLFLIPSVMAFAQESADTTLERADDPTPNRLFIMSTGRLVEPKAAVISLHELVVGEFPYAPSGQFTYAPSEHLQLSSSITPNPGVVGAGVKTQLAAPSGMFQGLAAGADIYGWVDRGAIMLAPMASIAASFGVPEFTLHAAAQAGYADGVDGGVTILQLGAETDLGTVGLPGVKLMGEMFLSPIDVAGDRMGVLGARYYGSRLNVDLAVILMQGFSFAGHAISPWWSPSMSVYPYLSLGWKL